MEHKMIRHPPTELIIGIITREYAREHPDYLFIFGDNDMRTGLGGLAKELRGEPNAIGIRVKKKPALTPDSFYTDDEYIDNIRKIDQDFQNLRANWFNHYTKIIGPINGIGTGLAKLKVKAPETWDHLLKQLVEHGFEYPL